jgi:hypothetical protein
MCKYTKNIYTIQDNLRPDYMKNYKHILICDSTFELRKTDDTYHEMKVVGTPILFHAHMKWVNVYKYTKQSRVYNTRIGIAICCKLKVELLM